MIDTIKIREVYLDGRIEESYKDVAKEIPVKLFYKGTMVYVYNLAMGSGGYSLSVAISILKSVVSIVLLVLANGFSKLVRGEGFI